MLPLRTVARFEVEVETLERNVRELCFGQPRVCRLRLGNNEPLSSSKRLSAENEPINLNLDLDPFFIIDGLQSSIIVPNTWKDNEAKPFSLFLSRYSKFLPINTSLIPALFGGIVNICNLSYPFYISKWNFNRISRASPSKSPTLHPKLCVRTADRMELKKLLSASNQSSISMKGLSPWRYGFDIP
jgi:hypothetical protein